MYVQLLLKLEEQLFLPRHLHMKSSQQDFMVSEMTCDCHFLMPECVLSDNLNYTMLKGCYGIFAR